MTQKNLISIIIPVYNAESTLEQTVQSILKQKSNLYELEILLINDGSKDSSENMCKMLANNSDCIKTYSKENGGVSSARNYGLCHANGDYVLFVDSDDLLLEGMLETLYKEIQRTEAELAWMGYRILSDGEQRPGFIPEQKIVIGAEKIVETLANLEVQCTTFVGAPWGKMFRRDVIENNQIRFPENTCYGEDFCFDADYFSKCKTIAFVSQSGYLYNMRETSLATHFTADSIEMYTFLREKKAKFYQNYPVALCFINTAYVEKMIACFGYILNCNEIRDLARHYFKQVIMTPCFQEVLRNHDYDIHSKYVKLMVFLCEKKKKDLIYIISVIKEIVKRNI